jgi:hypothetical protein
MTSSIRDDQSPHSATLPFEYHPSIKEYLCSAKEHLQQNREYDVVCVGAVVFNQEGKLLLVQRARTEKAFPEFWVLSMAMCQTVRY